MARRERLEIIRDILKIVKENKNSIKYTPLLRKSNLSSSRFNKYYKELLNKNLVKENNEDKNKYVILTDKGIRFLEKYKTIIDFIDEFEL